MLRKLDPVLLAFALLGVAPLVWAVMYAGAYSFELTGLLAHGFTTKHWEAMLGGSELWIALAYTAAISGVVVVGAVGLGLVIALTSNERLDRGVGALVSHVPLTFPAAVTGLVVFAALQGLVADRFATGIILAELFFAVPFLALAFRALYVSADVGKLEEIAASLGATPRQRLLRVSVPVLLRGQVTTIGLLFITTFGAFEIPQLLGRLSPQMISVVVMRKFARYDVSEKPEAMVIATLYAVAVSAILVLLFRRRGRA